MNRPIAIPLLTALFMLVASAASAQSPGHQMSFSINVTRTLTTQTDTKDFGRGLRETLQQRSFFQRNVEIFSFLKAQSPCRVFSYRYWVVSVHVHINRKARFRVNSGFGAPEAAT